MATNNNKPTCSTSNAINKKKKWNDSENLKFLELYEQEELLWNFKHKNYKNKDFRDNALKRLQEAFNLTQLEIKNRIKNLRSTYSQELAKIKGSKVSGTSSDEVYKCTLIWFETADRFLRDVIVTRKTSSNLENSIDEPEETEAQEGSDPSGSGIGGITQDERNDRDYAFLKPDKENKQKKRKKNDAPSYISTAIDKLEKLKDGIKDTDEFDHFGANIAMQLRNLPIEVSLVVQSKIMNLITKERIVHYTSVKKAPQQYDSSSSSGLPYSESPTSGDEDRDEDQTIVYEEVGSEYVDGPFQYEENSVTYYQMQ